jgi:D-glycero-D-manno-heptose 1,7-bisphosphate phosphatase
MSEPFTTVPKKRALFLDRDGVINEDTDYLHCIEDCVFIDGIFDLVAAFVARGYAIVVVTNQSGIARGYYGEAEFAALMGWMRAEFVRQGARIDAIYHCPDHPTDGIGRYRRENPWRKPGPGMLLQAAADLDLDLSGSLIIGDKESDMAAGRAAGLGTLVLYDEAAKDVRREGDVWIVPSLAAAEALVLP